MKELDGLREALASFKGPVTLSDRAVLFPGGDGSSAEVNDNNRAVYEDCAHVVQDDQCGCLEDCEENEKQKARALALSVNLAPHLLRVAEAAEECRRVSCSFPTKGELQGAVEALDAALDALRSTGAKGKGRE